MKISSLVALFFTAVSASAAPIKLPDVTEVASDVAGGFVTNTVNVKLVPANDNAIRGFVQQAMAITGCKNAKRIIPVASDGDLEDQHREAGLHLWYQFDCQGVDAVNPGKGSGPLKAIEKLSSLSDVGDSQKYGLAIVEVEYEIKMTGFALSKDDDRMLRSRRSLFSSNDPRAGEQLHYNTISLQGAWTTMTNLGSWSNLNDVVVQVLDSGWNMAHPDLGSNAWVNTGETCNDGTDNDNNGYIDDCNGYNHADDTGTDLLGSGSHGSHCSVSPVSCSPS